MTRLILASASPQRKTLLEGLGVRFDVLPSAVDEKACKESDPLERARVLAAAKAGDVACREEAWVIGCDTLVVSPKGALLEKPTDAAEAESMLRQQGGGTSLVHSGLALVSPDGDMYVETATSEVRFRTLSDADVAWWISTGLWNGRSGSFQIDGPGQLLIESICGDWTNIVGLPVFLLGQLCQKADAPFLRTRL